ncbi:hypothetical protein PHLGIDRAFT_62333 [Phlebiopsis gigantea 11061_1 CR5-6]|uniref:Cytochrome P450 n=1 Tax=Phlebiopsis gigantea (strain 11061_1 CR5-6) TaxID=745531 RepID=A0A0C3SE40_PHLG1|nr:hypothetical protein PHLGIDRAFT_62333 [Phlebiopsis gigantea 11061_1 CR5-6]
METFILNGLFVALFFLTIYYIKNRKRRRLPPGPPGLPIIGNVLDMPLKWEWIQYKKWSQQYNSDLIYLELFGAPIIVINSSKAAHDLFEKRSSIYSDRQPQVMCHEIVGWDKNIAFRQYGDGWRDRRRMFHQQFHPGAVHKYHHISSREAKKLLYRILNNPENFFAYIRTMGGAAILRATFGIDVKDQNDPYITIAEKALHSLSMTGNAGSYLVDYVPLLRYLPSWAPGTQFKRDGVRWRQAVNTMFARPIELVKESIARGKAEPSIAATLLADLDPAKDNTAVEAVIRDVTGTAYVGALSVSAMWTFVMAMILYPDVQKKAQQEIDDVVGSDRLPEHEDRDSLHYVHAVVRESLRWHLVTPLAVPHRLLVDDEYEGYHLPAGTVVVGNGWGMLHDEKQFPNPVVFDPNRWLTPEGQVVKQNPDPLDLSFGFGRRICPGRHFAKDTIFIAVSHMLATFNIQAVHDANGNPVIPNQEYTTGLIIFPTPFEASFSTRSAAAEALINASVLSE